MKLRFFPLLSLAAAFSATACAQHLTQSAAAASLIEFRSVIQNAADRRAFSCASWHVEQRGRAESGVTGWRLLMPDPRKADSDTIYDLASLTKVIATATAVMILVDEGKVDLNSPVRRYLPEFDQDGRELITVHQLLTHTSGMGPGVPLDIPWEGYEGGIATACRMRPRNPPDTVFRYSDLNFILLGEMVHRASGQPLDEFCLDRIFLPLGMKSTRYNPPLAWRERIAATARDAKGLPILGVVHDPCARRMGGVAGHAGLFSTAGDLARFCRMMLAEGILDGNRILSPEAVRLMTSVQSPAGLTDKRGLGWDIDSGYSKPKGGFPAGISYGHTGFTGTCLWLDPDSDSFFVFLCSRLHESLPGTSILKIYEDLGAAAARELLPAWKH